MQASVPKPRHRWFAAVYDSFISKMDDKKMAPMRSAVVAPAAGRVLEIGCGTGANLAHYDWSKVDSLDATEPDVYMLRRAEKHLADLPAEARAKVHLKEAPAEALPFEDASFDYVVCTLVLCSVTDPSRAIAEMQRVLKPGGRIGLVEHVQPAGFTRSVAGFIQPLYSWTSGGCRLDRQTEESLRSAGLDLEVTQRTALGPLWPAFVATATKR